ncbi:carbon-nitrogen hydrolase family protein [Vibrio profundum]|uniref:carbon-nitrogen hydrolase family protein n=1 Tax=Vibrio profundum TaxID=2910247 RepID=UPI003D0F53AB
MRQNEVTFALAQFEPVKGNITENLRIHEEICKNATRYEADVIVFPELSLTGYEPSLLADLALDSSSPYIFQLSKIASQYGQTLITGCPIKSGEPKPYISAVICHPSGKIDIYSKQYLHDGESDYCVSGDKSYVLKINQTSLGLAVCADFCSTQHQETAKADNIDAYLVSALISESGYQCDSDLLARIAVDMKVPVLLSNYVGMTGGWSTAGKSCVWDDIGNPIIQGSDSNVGITCCTLLNGSVSNSSFLPIR